MHLSATNSRHPRAPPPRANRRAGGALPALFIKLDSTTAVLFVQSHSDPDLICMLYAEEENATLHTVAPAAEEFPVRNCGKKGSIRVDEYFTIFINGGMVVRAEDGMVLGHQIEPEEVFDKLCHLIPTLCRVPITMLSEAGLQAGFPETLQLEFGIERSQQPSYRLLRETIRGCVRKEGDKWGYHEEGKGWRIFPGPWEKAFEALGERRENHQEY